MPNLLALLAGLLWAFAPAGAHAVGGDDEPVRLPVGPRIAPVVEPWDPPAPAEDAKDWLELVSGEWVRGEIERIVDEKVYFDSDELDDLEIDWKDVASFASARMNTFRFTPPLRSESSRFEDVIVTGSAAMREGVIRVDTGTEVREFSRDRLLTMIQGGLREINYWSLKLVLGATVRAGNSDQVDQSGRLKIERETPLTRLHLSYESANSTVDQKEITNNQRARSYFAVYLTRRLFLLAPTAEAFRDRIQNIDLRATIGGGVGYELFNTPKVEWDVVLGAGYQRTDYGGVGPDESSTADDAAGIFSTNLELDPWKDVDWDTTYQLQAVVTDFDKTNHHLLSEFSVEIWGPLDLDLSFAWDRVEGPARNAAGELPERNDFRLTVGLALDL